MSDDLPKPGRGFMRPRKPRATMPPLPALEPVSLNPESEFIKTLRDDAISAARREGTNMGVLVIFDPETNEPLDEFTYPRNMPVAQALAYRLGGWLTAMNARHEMVTKMLVDQRAEITRRKHARWWAYAAYFWAGVCMVYLVRDFVDWLAR